MSNTTKHREFLNKIKELVQTNEQYLALEQLGTYVRPISEKEYDTVVMLKASYNGIMDNVEIGVYTKEEEKTELASLNRRILLFIKRLPQILKLQEYRAPQPPQEIPVTDAKAQNNFDRIKDEGTLEKLIGNTSDLKRIAWLRKGVETSRSVGRILTPNEYGSGFLIKGEFLITNNHVLPTAEIAANSIVEMNYEEGINRSMLPTTIYKLQPDVFFSTNAELDFSIVKVNTQAETGGEPLSHWGHLSIDASPTGVPANNSRVIIIQHPNGGPKQIAITNNQVVNIYNGNYVQYTTDTLPGSSGSPVFDEKWNVIALHHKGGNLKTNKWGAKRFINQGVLFAAIQQALGTELLL